MSAMARGLLATLCLLLPLAAQGRRPTGIVVRDAAGMPVGGAEVTVVGQLTGIVEL